MRGLAAWFVAGVLTLGSALQAQVSAQDWPARQVTIVVPFGAGGSADLLARILATHMQPKFGQGRVGLFDDLVNGVDIGMIGLPPACQRPILMYQVLTGGLHGRDGAVFGGGQLDQLPGTPPRLGRQIKVVAQQQQERRACHE